MALREASKLSSKPRFEILSFIRSNLDQKFKKSKPIFLYSSENFNTGEVALHIHKQK